MAASSFSPSGIAVDTASNLMVTKAGVAQVATPDAGLNPAVLSVSAERSPLVIASASLTTAIERSTASAVWAVDFVPYPTSVERSALHSVFWVPHNMCFNICCKN